MKRLVLVALHSLLLVTIVLFFLAGCSTESALDPSAETIISRTREAYANCNSYQDTGVMSVTSASNSIYTSATSTEIISFSTAFVRSDRFRFEYKDLQSRSQPNFIIWRNGEDVLSWWDVAPGIQTQDALAMAIAGAYGVSYGLSGEIPSFLMPDQAGIYQIISNAQRLENAVVDGVNCYRIIDISGNNQVIYWIDTNTYLIRRIETQSISNNNSTILVTAYNPSVDGPVSDDALAFNPPLPNGDVGDRVVITNVTPTSVSSNQTTTFTVEVSYTLSSNDSGVLRVSDQDVAVSRGTGTLTFNVAEMPLNDSFNSYFFIRVSLYANQQPFPLAYHEKFIIISPSTTASISLKRLAMSHEITENYLLSPETPTDMRTPDYAP